MDVTIKPENTAWTEPSRQGLTFMLGKKSFALDVQRVKKVVDYREMTAVTGMPNFVRGVVDLGGTVVPVVDMGVYDGDRPSVAKGNTRIIVIEVDGNDKTYSLGIVVDAIFAPSLGTPTA